MVENLASRQHKVCVSDLGVNGYVAVTSMASKVLGDRLRRSPWHGSLPGLVDSRSIDPSSHMRLQSTVYLDLKLAMRSFNRKRDCPRSRAKRDI